MNNILPAAGSLSGGSSPLLPPNLSRSGSLDSGPQLLVNSPGGRLLTVGRRPSLEQLKAPVSSPYTSHHIGSALSVQVGGPPDLNKVGQYGKDQPQPLPILNTSPTSSIPASVLMPPPALKMVNDTLPRAEAMRRDHVTGNANREFLDPPVLKQELKETELLSMSKHNDYNAKRKVDTTFSADCSYVNSPNKTEPIWDNLCKVDSLMKFDAVEPDSKKLKMSSSSSLDVERKSVPSSKTHSSKDSISVKRNSSKSTVNVSGTSNSGTSTSKVVEKDSHSQKCEKVPNNSGKHHGDKGKSTGSTSKPYVVSGQKLDHSKPEGKSSPDKLKSHNKDKLVKKDGVNKEHKGSEKKDSKVKAIGTNNSNSHTSGDAKHKVKDVGQEESKLRHADKTCKRPDKHKTQRCESKEKLDTMEKGTPEKADTNTDKNTNKKAEKERVSGSSGRKHDSSHKHDDKSKSDKINCEKSKERHKSGDSLSKSKPNKSHNIDKPGHCDKTKDVKKTSDIKRTEFNDHSNSLEKKSSQDKHKSKFDSKDKSSKMSSKDKCKDSTKNKEAKKNAKNKSATTPEKSSPKGKDKQDDKSPIARKREKSGSHSEEIRSEQSIINQELFDQEELEMLAPFLSMYELVKTRSHKERDKPEASNKMDSLFGDYKVIAHEREMAATG
jgi:hypothetical protein